MPRVSRASELDDIDRRIIELLARDGRAGNRRLAQEVGLTDTTVAARIRRLREDGVLGVTAVFDWEAAGYSLEAFLYIEVAGRLPREVGQEVAALPEAHGVSLTFGSADLIVHTLAESREQLGELLTTRVVAVDGVQRVTSDFGLETVQHRWGLATLPENPEPTITFPNPVVAIDDFDRSLVACLVHDGRQSNREIARQLGVSDGTIRTRIRRLEDSGLMRIVAQTDPVALGLAGSIAHVGVEVEGASAGNVARVVAEWPEVAACTITAGIHDLHVVVAAPDMATMGELVAERLRGVAGVRRTTTWPAVDVLKHEYHLVRLLEGANP